MSALVVPFTCTDLDGYGSRGRVFYEDRLSAFSSLFSLYGGPTGRT